MAIDSIPLNKIEAHSIMKVKLPSFSTLKAIGGFPTYQAIVGRHLQ